MTSADQGSVLVGTLEPDRKKWRKDINRLRYFRRYARGKAAAAERQRLAFKRRNDQTYQVHLPYTALNDPKFVQGAYLWLTTVPWGRVRFPPDHL